MRAADTDDKLMSARILVTDDSRVARRFHIARIPKREGLEVREASGGHEAVALYREQPFDIVLMDLTMPDGDGFEALEQIRAHDQNARVVIITADIQPKAQERCLALGALRVVPKPISPEAMESLIGELLG